MLIEPKISHYLFQITDFGGHIGFCAHRPPGGYPNLYAVVFENLMPIPNTMPNCKNIVTKCAISLYEYAAIVRIGHCNRFCCSYFTFENENRIRFSFFVCKFQNEKRKDDIYTDPGHAKKANWQNAPSTNLARPAVLSDKSAQTRECSANLIAIHNISHTLHRFN